MSNLGAFALSEPASGSDAFALETRADDKGTHWELTGRKFWITNGGEAGIVLIFANTDFAKGYKGITAFLVERDFPGFAVGKKENKLSIRASSTTELILESCRVPKENVLGPVGIGYKIAIETLNEGRIGIGAQMLGTVTWGREQGEQQVHGRIVPGPVGDGRFQPDEHGGHPRNAFKPGTRNRHGRTPSAKQSWKLPQQHTVKSFTSKAE